MGSIDPSVILKGYSTLITQLQLNGKMFWELSSIDFRFTESTRAIIEYLGISIHLTDSDPSHFFSSSVKVFTNHQSSSWSIAWSLHHAYALLIYNSRSQPAGDGLRW